MLSCKSIYQVLGWLSSFGKLWSRAERRHSLPGVTPGLFHHPCLKRHHPSLKCHHPCLKHHHPCLKHAWYPLLDSVLPYHCFCQRSCLGLRGLSLFPSALCELVLLGDEGYRKAMMWKCCPQIPGHTKQLGDPGFVHKAAE